MASSWPARYSGYIGRPIWRTQGRNGQGLSKPSSIHRQQRRERLETWNSDLHSQDHWPVFKEVVHAVDPPNEIVLSEQVEREPVTVLTERRLLKETIKLRREATLLSLEYCFRPGAVIPLFLLLHHGAGLPCGVVRASPVEEFGGHPDAWTEQPSVVATRASSF
eukprot:scaffold218_cov333-Prasinococcus_capsulatus_cf.AAC.2